MTLHAPAQTQTVRKRGQQPTYTEEIAEEILERVAEGESLGSICNDPYMPARSTVSMWAGADGEKWAPGFADRYARARLLGIDRLADEVLSIGDEQCIGPDGFVDNGAVQRARLACDNRKWLLSKLLPRTYGDKVTAEITGDPNAPLVTRIELVAVDPRPVIEHKDDE